MLVIGLGYICSITIMTMSLLSVISFDGKQLICVMFIVIMGGTVVLPIFFNSDSKNQKIYDDRVGVLQKDESDFLLKRFIGKVKIFNKNK